MSEEPLVASKIGDEVEAMVHDLFLDGVTRLLEKRFPGAGAVVYEDAIAESVARLLDVGARREVDNPRGYLTTVALNEMRATMRRAAREVLPEPDDEDDVAWFDAGRDNDRRPTEEDAMGRIVYEYVRSLVDRWESRNLRATTLLVLEGARIGEPLSGAELAERLGDILERDVIESTARQWRRRGLKRLRKQLADEGFDIQDA